MPIIKIETKDITTPQIEYIEILMIDLEIWDRRKFFYKEYVGKDDINAFTRLEATQFIQLLKIWKENGKD